MNKLRSICSIILYVTTAILTIFYFAVTSSRNLIISPSARLMLIILPCLTVYMGSLVGTADKKKSMKIAFGVIFGFYLILITTLVLFDAYYGRVGHISIFEWDKELFARYINNSTNFIPFATVWKYICAYLNDTMNLSIIITNLAGNVIAFAPFGFFLPLLWKKQRNFGRFSLTVTLTVITVELLQFVLLVGSCDIDDLILNVLGAMAVFGFIHIYPVKKLIEKITFLEY